MSPIDTDYMEVSHQHTTRSACAAILREHTSGPGFGKWEVVPMPDGRYAVRKAGVGVAIISGSYATAEEAQCEADGLNSTEVNGGHQG